MSSKENGDGVEQSRWYRTETNEKARLCPPHHVIEIMTADLESAVESVLAEFVHSADNDDHDDDDGNQVATMPAKHIAMRHDSSLMECKRPSVPIESIFGFSEECLIDDDDEEHDPTSEMPNPTVTMQVHLVETMATEVTDQQDLAPHSDWERVRLEGAEQLREDPFQPSMKLLNFFASAAAAPMLESDADCCNFLRVILGSSHHGSVWTLPSKDTDDLCSCISLLMPGGTEKYFELAQFRTNDACPSYFLHSTCQLELTGTDSLSRIMKRSTNGESTMEASLFVYRRLSPRNSLFSTRPSSGDTGGFVEPLPDGCLWQTSMREKEEDSNEEADGNDDDDDEEEEEKEWFEQVVLPSAPPYVSYRQEYGNLLDPLLSSENLNVIRQEALSIPQWTAWPERQHYSSSKDGSDEPTWTVFPLCHCFPANDVSQRKFLDMTCNFVPNTMRLLKESLGDVLRTALFSRMRPETTLEAHTGWEDLANHVYRLHLPLVVPKGGLCGTWVDGVVETHEEGRPLCFDDSKVHRAFNYSKEDRIVLIVDLARPESLPLGTAIGGHTDELDDFINSIS